jgi:hypothetical protein
LEVLDSIDDQGEKLKEFTLAGSIGVISSLLKFIYNSCIITVGSRVFGYSDKSTFSCRNWILLNSRISNELRVNINVIYRIIFREREEDRGELFL